MSIVAVWFFAWLCVSQGVAEYEHHHPRVRRRISEIVEPELGREFWTEKGQNILLRHLAKGHNTNIAKNVIFFIGDGMSLQTVTAGRIYKGQLEGKTGEEDQLSFEKFPYSGLSKTYCVDTQVADSACTATAYLGGVKANEGTIGVTAAVTRLDCQAMNNVSNHVSSIAQWAQEAGKSTGLVTTTRVTHASPAGLYAHVAERSWEEDDTVSSDGYSSRSCPDIAQQLILQRPGKDLNVIMGGGRRSFLPHDKAGPDGAKGKRRDKMDLIRMWMEDKMKRNATFRYVTNRTELMSIESCPQFLLGLFASSHMDYHIEGKKGEPTLEEMTTQAIRHLRKNPKGYFLFVEGGNIDLAHHENMARKSLDETVELSKAVAAAVKMTDEEDTLIVVTADHSHVMTVNGYPRRGNNIFGFAGEAPDGLPYTTLSYANGPGFVKTDIFSRRQNLRSANINDKSYRYPSMVSMRLETHGGDDVPVYATGPWSHIFSGAFEQSYIPHGIGYAACLGQGLTACQKPPRMDHKVLLPGTVLPSDIY